MASVYENDILIECDECYLEINRKIREKVEFEIPRLRATEEESRKEFLTFLINFLYTNCSKPSLDFPQFCRKEVTNKLLEHGQFSKEEIDNIFEEESVQSNCYSKEFIESHPKIDFVDLMLREHGKNDDKDIPIEFTYQFPVSSCDHVNYLGLCKIDVEILKCPGCGREVENTPQNVNLHYDKDLLCPVCIRENDDPFSNKGVVKEGRPKHHGDWSSQEPELVYTGTDYFTVLHPKCKKSKRDDGKGVMEVHGVWIDNKEGRVVLSLKCHFCGCRNAIKPWTTKSKLPIYDASGATWKWVESDLAELLNREEDETLEFKPCLRFDTKIMKINKAKEQDVAESIVAFMNTFGGKLLIGISDAKEILGLKKDYNLIGKNKGKRDWFQLQINNVVNEYIGKENRKFIRVSFENYMGEDICILEVDKSPKPLFYRANRNKPEFIVRTGNADQRLNREETLKYIAEHWRNRE